MRRSWVLSGGNPSHLRCRAGGPLPVLPPTRLALCGIGLRPMLEARS